MTYLEAALNVLKMSGRAMTAKEITTEALARGMLGPSGKTPDASMAAVLYCYVRDDEDARIQRLAEPGPTRARRGSVTWSFKTDD